ncbi:MAG: hypothetical protein ABL960_13860 [Nitrospira sp.]
MDVSVMVPYQGHFHVATDVQISHDRLTNELGLRAVQLLSNLIKLEDHGLWDM